MDLDHGTLTRAAIHLESTTRCLADWRPASRHNHYIIVVVFKDMMWSHSRWHSHWEGSTTPE